MTTTKNSSVIDAQTLAQLHQQDAITLVDVREPLEFVGEHIPGAQSFPLSRFNPSQIPHQEGKLIVLYCQSGNRSGQALQRLYAAELKDAVHLQGGLPTWKQAGLPTIKSTKAPISLMRQVQIVAGSLVLTGTLLGAFVAPAFLVLSGFVGAGLLFAGASGTCMMANLLAKLPYNQVK